MDFQNTVLAATVGLLTCPDVCLDDALARCDGLFDSTVLYSTGKPSVAVRSAAGVTPLREWVMGMRANGPLACRPAFEGGDNEDMPEHMMAGFLGGRPGTLHVRHAGGSHSYSAGTISSDIHAMTVAQFADLIDAQADPAFYWAAILADINQFHSCNGIVEVEPDQLADFLLSDAAVHAWNFTGAQIVREIQVEALTMGVAFTIPAHLAHLFEEVRPFHAMHRYVWLEAFDEDEVTGAQLVQLVMAQAFYAEIWRICADPQELAATLGEDYDLSEFPHIDAQRWADYLQGLDAIDAELMRDDLLELIRLECQRRDCEPLIPAALADVFGPDEEERRRLMYRGRLQHDMGWYLKRHPAPWRMFVFDEESSEASAADDAADDAANMVEAGQQQRFEAALEAIEAFALQAQSPFAAQFRLAKRLAVQARAHAPFDRAAFERICASNPMPEHGADAGLVDLFAAFGWGNRRVFGLAAVAAADVFGAMGSWNDQSMDEDESIDDDEEAQFEAVSSQLFGAMNAYLASLLTVGLRDAPAAVTPLLNLARTLRRLLPGGD